METDSGVGHQIDEIEELRCSSFFQPLTDGKSTLNSVRSVDKIQDSVQVIIDGGKDFKVVIS